MIVHATLPFSHLVYCDTQPSWLYDIGQRGCTACCRGYETRYASASYLRIITQSTPSNLNRTSPTMLSTLEQLPAEIFILIFDSLAREEFFCLQLTSKHLQTLVTTLRAVYRHPRETCFSRGNRFCCFIETHLKVENEMAKRFKVQDLICTSCGKVKRRYDKHGFRDCHSQIGVLYRFCVLCDPYNQQSSCNVCAEEGED